jgi:cyanophycinase
MAGQSGPPFAASLLLVIHERSTMLRPGLVLLLLVRPAFADTTAPPRLDPGGIKGAVVLVGSADPSEATQKRFLGLAGGNKAHLAVVASGEREPADKLVAAWKALEPASVVLLSMPAKTQVDKDALANALKHATGVWLVGPVEAAGQEEIKKGLGAVLARGGVVGGGSRAIRFFGSVTPATAKQAETPGLDLVPEAVVFPPDLDLVVRNPQLPAKRGLFALRLKTGTTLVIRGRDLEVSGDQAFVWLAEGTGRAERLATLAPGRSDWTLWCRAAQGRAGSPWPPATPGVPEVPKGSLVIVGGGGMPAEVTKNFIELAGGPDALIVVLPTANPDPVPANAEATFLSRAGARNVKVLPARTLADVEDPKNLAILKEAGGVWFGGGRQWRFVDAYAGTKAEEAFRDVLRRGGVIGGSSAGATIQGDYLCRGSPLNNTDVQCEGYERGLGFLPGVAIDQHFTQRKRHPDMTALMKEYPQFLGIGLDEATAIIVKGTVAEVMGRGKAHFYDTKRTTAPGEPDYEALAEGGRYDLKARKVLGEKKE